MERNIVHLFENRDDAVRAVQEIHRMGIDRDDISIMSGDREFEAPQGGKDLAHAEHQDSHAGEGAATGASTGALVGGGAGLLAGLGLLAIPGLGPIVAAGWLASLATGAVAGAAVGGATGGVIGALIKSGVPEDEAHIYSEGIHRGGTLVSVRNPGPRAQSIEATLNAIAASDIAATGERYRATGWSGKTNT